MATSIVPDKILFQQGIRATGQTAAVSAGAAMGSSPAASGSCGMFLIAARSWTTTLAAGSMYLCSGVDGVIRECVQLLKESSGPSVAITGNGSGVQITFENTNGGVYAVLPVM